MVTYIEQVSDDEFWAEWKNEGLERYCVDAYSIKRGTVAQQIRHSFFAKDKRGAGGYQ